MTLTDLLAAFPTRTLLDDGTERHMLYSGELNALIAVVEAASHWREDVVRGQSGGYADTCQSLDNLERVLGGEK